MKKINVMVGVFLIFILAGCTPRQINPDQTTTEYVYSGTRGIDMKFMLNLPPRKIYDTATLEMIAELENKGAYDLTGGNCILHLAGYDSSIIRGIQNEKSCGSNLFGKSPGFPEGGYDVAEFKTDLIRLPEGIDSFPQKFTLSACYEYETNANPIVCIDPQQYKIRSIQEACVVQDAQVSGGQGAPVAVTRVEVDMVGANKAAFVIHVSNLGGGTVLANGVPLSGRGYGSCPFNLQYEDYNTVDYQITMTDGFMIKCSPEKLRLVNNAGKIFCTFNVPGEYARKTPLRIKLWYSYLQTITKDLEIVKTPE